MVIFIPIVNGIINKNQNNWKAEKWNKRKKMKKIKTTFIGMISFEMPLCEYDCFTRQLTIWLTGFTKHLLIKSQSIDFPGYSASWSGAKVSARLNVIVDSVDDWLYYWREENSKEKFLQLLFIFSIHELTQSGAVLFSCTNLFSSAPGKQTLSSERKSTRFKYLILMT